jgi:paraquat-inducible protein A
VHLERKPVTGKQIPALLPGKKIITLLFLLYAAGAAPSAWNIIEHSHRSTMAIEKIFALYNMQNEETKALERYSKEHPLLGTLFSGPIKHAFELPSTGQADEALGPELKSALESVRHEACIAAWWSWFLLSASLTYAVAVIAIERSFHTRAVFFALTSISLTCFVIGILAPAMVVWTAPTIPMQTGDLSFVLQHQVRGIAAIIWDLLKAGHWIIGGFLLLFSIITPLTKASLTYFVTLSRSKELNYRIGQLLHSIGKWSMADVFVAGIILALYALKYQEATRSIPCLGLYYFIGYCLFSLTTTELLVHSGLVSGNDPSKAEKKLGRGVIVGLLVGLICYIPASALYTFQQYTTNTEQHITPSTSPQKLNNADLVLPAHK